MTENSSMERVRNLVAPIIRDLHLDLYDLEFRGGTLRVTIDTPAGSPGGVNLEQIALATRLISRDFDHHDPIAGHYTLEVTSPGLERTLRLPAHYQRELGKVVAVRLRDTAGANRRFQGVLVAATDADFTVRLDELHADGTFVERTVPFGLVDRAKTVFEWGPTPKPSIAPAATKPTKAGAGMRKAGAGMRKPAPKKTATTSRERRAESRATMEPKAKSESKAKSEAKAAREAPATSRTRHEENRRADEAASNRADEPAIDTEAS
jgi:ribosome maturation factor RimP